MSCRFILSKALSPKKRKPVPDVNSENFDRDVEIARFYSFLQRARLNLYKTLNGYAFESSTNMSKFYDNPFLAIIHGRIDVLIDLCDKFDLPLSTNLPSISGDEFNSNYEGDNRSLLHVSCEKGDVYAAYVLLSRGASPNSQICMGGLQFSCQL